MIQFRKPRQVEYNDLNGLVLKNLTPESKHILFYYSLFDPSGWEEDFIKAIETKNFLKERKREILKIIKTADKTTEFRKKYIVGKPYSDGTQKVNFLIDRNSDRLCKFLIASELEKNGIRLSRKGLLPKKTIYPDLIVEKVIENRSWEKKAFEISVEIKFLISCSNLSDRIENEIVPEIKEDEANNILLVLLFPSWGKEDPKRINKLIQGFYFLEKYLSKETNKKVKVICQYIDKSYSKDSEHSFNYFIKRLVDIINSYKLNF
jgi:hypothetical protein